MKDERRTTCGLCGRDAAKMSTVAEDFVFHLIRKDHPEWVRENGACPDCLACYLALDDVIALIGEDSNR